MGVGRLAARLRPPYGLSLRLGALLSIALLPIGVLSVAMTLRVLEASRDSRAEALTGLTTEAVALHEAVLANAFGAAGALGRVALERRDEPEACAAALRETIAEPGLFAAAALLDAEGRAICASAPSLAAPAGAALFAPLIRSQGARVARLEAGGALAEPMIAVVRPIAADAGGQVFALIALPERVFVALDPFSDRPTPRLALIFNGEGEFIAANPPGEAAEALRPADLSLAELVGAADTIFTGRTVSGEPATFLISGLKPGRLYVLGVWDRDRAPGPGAVSIASALALPLLMWAASLAVAYVATHNLAIRHIRRLNRRMRRFAAGEDAGEGAAAADAPLELRELGATFTELTRRILDNQAAMEASVREKTVLLKEVHHRVKNNLQLITSIISMQIRKAAAPETERVLRSVQDRVMSLAAIHQGMYQAEDLGALRADALIDRILRQTLALGAAPEGAPRLDLRLEPVRLDADRVVPLSLLANEAVTNALKHLGRPEGGDARPWLRVVLRVDRDGATLFEVVNPVAEGRGPARSSSLGSQLIEAFAAQLGGALESGEETERGARVWRLSLRFAAAAPEHEKGPAAEAAGP